MTARVNAGVPAGGQYTSHSRAEADADLHAHSKDAPTTTDHVYSPNLPELDVLPGDPVGFTYQAENISWPTLVEKLIREGRLAPGARGMRANDALDQLAAIEDVDRDDEYTFDSSDFPKPILKDELGCSDQEWAGTLAPPHVGFLSDEFPVCARCGADLA